MGYDLRITRAKDWTLAEFAPITLDEWVAVVEADAEMRLDGYAEVCAPSGAIRFANKGLAVWTKYSGHDEIGNGIWFDYRSGCIVVKGADEEILEKMKQIAAKLGANVLGDEGEEY